MSFKAKTPRRKDSEMSKAMKDVAQEPTTRLNVEVPESLMKKLKVVVAQKDTTIKDYLNRLLITQINKDVSS